MILAILKDMTRYFVARLLWLALSVGLLPLTAAKVVAAPEAPARTASEAASRPGTNAVSLKPGPNDGKVAYWTAHLLEKAHYSHHPFDDAFSSQFLDRYLESLDPRHLVFLQADLDQFERYRTNLDNLTITPERAADTGPAFEIFSRFMERTKQRVAYVDELLQAEPFVFDTDERIVINRHESPYPRDLNEAKALWRQQLRYEYLAEKLGREGSNKSKADAAKVAAGKTVHEQIVETLTHRYHRNLRMFADWDNADVLGVYLTALAHVYDPHSDYFNRDQMSDFAVRINLELFGIGAELFSDDGYCKIRRLLPGPAAKSQKIKAGDRIVAVAQSNQPPVDIIDMSLSKVVQMIRGPKGTEVRLTLVPADDPGARAVVSLIRDEIPLEDQAAKGKIIDLPNGPGQNLRLGVIQLPSFYAPLDLGGPKAPDLAQAGEPAAHSTSVDVAKLLDKFKRENVAGVVLDLRGNAGGSLEEAIRVTGLFIKDGPVVQVRASNNAVQVDRDEDPAVAYEGPLIVLTSRFSASASEIVAGALQDYGRGLIVGDSSTHGKGTVQNFNPLRPFMRMTASQTNDPGALKVTIRKFYRPSGSSTQKKGVLPDVVLPSVLNAWKDLGEASLENPLPWDTIPSVKYEKLNLVQPYLSELLRRSTGRIATNQEFAYIREDIEQYRKQQADKTVSLNEKQRLQEIREAEARQKARDKERRLRREPQEKVYEISLKQADLPGLPPSVQRTNSLASTSSPGGSTGVAAAVAGKAAPADPASSDEPDEAAPPPVDSTLEEAGHIMSDYISLLPKDSPLLAAQAGAVR
jgi:carboxyl-terminal processing protease